MFNFSNTDVGNLLAVFFVSSAYVTFFLSRGPNPVIVAEDGFWPNATTIVSLATATTVVTSLLATLIGGVGYLITGIMLYLIVRKTRKKMAMNNIEKSVA